MNILITDGAGFIGTSLTKKLLEDGHNVFIVDDLSTGDYRNIITLDEFKRKLASSGSSVNLQWIKRNIISSLDSQKGSEGFNFEQIYHLACPASPPKYYLDPLKTLDVCYLGTKNILELAKYFNARVLFTSTSEIYGDPLEHPQKESYNGNVNPVSPRSVYDEGKRVAETLVSEYGRQGLDTRIARIFNTYGPYMDPNDGRVVTNFIGQYLHGKPFTIYGDGKQTRSFCYIDDTVDGLIALMNSDKFINEPVNIGNPEEVSMVDLACEIYTSMKMPLRQAGRLPMVDLVMRPMPVSDPAKRKPDISKMESIGWTPKVSLRDGLKKTIEYFESKKGEFHEV